MIKFKVNQLHLIFLSLLGCAPGLGTSLEMTNLPPIEVDSNTQLESYELMRARVDSFIDTRGEAPFVSINGRAVESSNHLGPLVQTGLEDALKGYGGKPCLFDCMSIGGEIRQWKLNVTPGFPLSKANARAELRIWIKDQRGQEILKGYYRGAATSENPIYSESMMTKDLGVALNESIKSFFTDEKVVRVLNR